MRLADTNLHAVCGSDDPAITKYSAAADVRCDIQRAVDEADLPRPSVRCRLFATDDARGVRRDGRNPAFY